MGGDLLYYYNPINSNPITPFLDPKKSFCEEEGPQAQMENTNQFFMNTALRKKQFL